MIARMMSSQPQFPTIGVIAKQGETPETRLAVARLARYLRQRAAARLAPGQSLDVTLTDIRRAGNYESWHGPRGNDVRIVRDLYPPRIELRFVLHGVDGAVLAQGERKLSDLGFLQDATRLDDSDPLRFEKSLIDDWLRREFPAGGRPGA